MVWPNAIFRVILILSRIRSFLPAALALNRIFNFGQAATEEHERFAERLRSKYIDINITDQNNRDTNNFIPGIVLATNVPQAGSDAYEYYSGTNMPKDSGGVGITDLQIETGTKEFMNRRYKLRLTVTDPQALNDNPEYLKLTSLQSKFLIISFEDFFIHNLKSVIT